MSQNYNWPAASVTATNPSVAPNGQSPSATSSTLVAGQTPGGAQEPLQLDNLNNLLVNVQSSALPTGSATAANQVLEIAQLTGIHSDTTSLNGKTVHVDTGAVVVASSALPTGAATSANQTNGNQVTQVSNFPATQPVSGTVTVVQPTGTNLHTVVDSSALPTGASTSALQTTGNSSLSSIDTKTPALGQALAAASVPVVLTAAQLTTLTPLTSVTVTQATGTNLHTVVDSGTVNAKAATPTALTLTQAAITVGTSAVRLTVSGSAPSATRVVLVANADSASTAKFYIGSSSVTNTSTNRGPQFVAGQTFIANNDAGDYYIISDTAAQTVYVMEQS